MVSQPFISVYGPEVSAFIERLIHETYAAHVILTNSGVLPDEIFVSVAPILNSANHAPHGVVLVKRGDLQFVLKLQPVTDDQAQRYLDGWRDFVTAKPTMPKEALDQIVYGSVLYGQRAGILAALAAKGLEPLPGRLLN